MMRPPPASFIPGMAYLEHRNVPRRLMSITRSQVTSSIFIDRGGIDVVAGIVDQDGDGGIKVIYHRLNAVPD